MTEHLFLVLSSLPVGIPWLEQQRLRGNYLQEGFVELCNRAGPSLEWLWKTPAGREEPKPCELAIKWRAGGGPTLGTWEQHLWDGLLGVGGGQPCGEGKEEEKV